jgi:hypothetical protein
MSRPVEGWPRQGTFHGGGKPNWGKRRILWLRWLIKGENGCVGFVMT